MTVHEAQEVYFAGLGAITVGEREIVDMQLKVNELKVTLENVADDMGAIARGEPTDGE